MNPQDKRTYWSDLVTIEQAIEKYCISFPSEPLRVASERFVRYYCNLKPLTLHPYWASKIAPFIREIVDNSGAEAIGSLAPGCISLTTMVGYGFELLESIPTFFVRNQPKLHGLESERILSSSLCDDPPLIKPGRKVAVVEDVVNSGGSALEVVEVLESLGCEVVLVVCVVERHESGGGVFVARGTPFQALFHTTEAGELSIDETVEVMFKPAR